MPFQKHDFAVCKTCPRHGLTSVRRVKLIDSCRTRSKRVRHVSSDRVRHVSSTCRTRVRVRHTSDMDTPLIWACPCFIGFGIRISNICINIGMYHREYRIILVISGCIGNICINIGIGHYFNPC